MSEHPSSTYRLQIRQAFDLDAAAAVTDYLRDLGVGWAYLSPLLTAATGSDHGYDVVDPTRVDPARGGADGLDRFAVAARAAGLGILIDIVPNHMGIADPRENHWWWDLLTHGRDSSYAEAFDIDWDYGHDRVRVPVLGSPLDEAIADIEIRTDASRRAPFGTLRYFDHVLPLAPGSVPAGADLRDAATVRSIADAQHYELSFWRDEATALNHRRFFTVTTLAGVRVEVPWVFDETHAEVVRWIREGLADGLRIDHPDGLRDPGAYLERLAAATDGTYVVVEKILEPDVQGEPEALAAWWETDGTTGYDALGEGERVLIDASGEDLLDALDARLRAGTDLPEPQSWHELIHDTKRDVADTTQAAEVGRLVRTLPASIDLPPERARDALAELLACFPTYRSYLPAGRRWLAQAAAAASAHRPDLTDAIDALVPVLADPSEEVAQRFQQTAGPVMAKGVEDRAFYRYTRLGSLTEVGGDPGLFSSTVDEYHRAQATRQSGWPRAMTTLSTHDTKRGEDVRARLDVLAEVPQRWADVLDASRAIASTGHGPFDNLLYQAIVGSWPASRERLHDYAEKAAREAAERTNWFDPDAAFEDGMHVLVDAVFDDADLAALLRGFVAEISAPGWSNSLSLKLLQLAGPGVPDVYQGSELWETSLVDPDNRRAVDYEERRRLLAELDGGLVPPVDETGAAKLLVVSRALRLRRDRPELFARYTPMTVVGPGADHAIAYDRGGALVVATRLPVGLEARGGWGDTALLRHAGAVTDAFTGRRFDGSTLRLSEVLSVYPVALLVAE
ncbi:malto-oligosyltrehalose synthase [Microbacterium sp. P03]|uniref:malto-oligosyltrehalose synthase n=1 Tax=Microbacterium sp. P03 TaxID=3366946 RepID=UPI00374656F4